MKIVLPSSLLSIEHQAFYWSQSLESIEIGGSLTTFEDYLFRDCSNLKFISIGGKTLFENGTLNFSSINVTQLGKACFVGLNVKEVIIPETLQLPKFPFFDYRDTLEKIVFAFPLLNIEDHLFSYCTKVQTIQIENQILLNENIFNTRNSLITTIGNYAFQELPIKSAFISSIISSMNSMSLAGISKLETIDFDLPIENYSLSFQTMPSLITCSVQGVKILENQQLTFPNNNQKSIPPYAYDRTNIIKASFPYTINTFSEGIFARCPKLETVVIDYPIVSVSYSMFLECQNLISISIANFAFLQSATYTLSALDSIGNFAFSRSAFAKKIIFSNNDISLGVESFSENPSLEIIEFVVIPKSISGSPFFNCLNLACIIFPSNYDCNDFSNIDFLKLMNGSSLAKFDKWCNDDLVCKNPDSEKLLPAPDAVNMSKVGVGVLIIIMIAIIVISFVCFFLVAFLFKKPQPNNGGEGPLLETVQ